MTGLQPVSRPAEQILGFFSKEFKKVTKKVMLPEKIKFGIRKSKGIKR